MSRPLYIRLAQRQSWQSFKSWFSDILLLCGMFTTRIRSNAHTLMYDLAYLFPGSSPPSALETLMISQYDLLQGRKHLQTSQSWGFWPPCRCASESFLFRNQRDLQRVLQKLALWLCYSSKRTQEDLDHFQIGLSIPCRYFLQAEEQASPALDNDSFSSQAALLFSFSSVDSKELKLFNVCCRVVISRFALNCIL